MRGFGGLTEAIDAMLGSAGLSLPPWAFPALLVVGFVFMLPHIRQNQRTDRARKLIRERSETGGAATDAFHHELLEIAAGHPVTLLVIAHEAHKYGQIPMAKKALKELEASGRYRTETHRLRTLLFGPPPVHPEAEYAAIEKLVDQELWGLAANRIRRAQQHWPHEPRLARWLEQMPTEE